MNRREALAAFAAVTLPARALSQPVAQPRRLALVHVSTPIEDLSEKTGSPFIVKFLSELRRLGYVEGENLRISRHSGGGRSEHYAELAREAVAASPEVIQASGARLVRQLYDATKTIPIVAAVSDPVAAGLVESLSHPGGNVTGFTTDPGLEVFGKNFDVLSDLRPGLKRVGLLAPRAVWGLHYGRTLIEAAAGRRIEVVGPPLDGTIDEREYKRVVDAMAAAKVDAFVVADVPENSANIKPIVSLINQTRLPALYPSAAYVRSGGLLSYGVDLSEVGVGLANYVDLIFKGAKPASMPFQQPRKIALAVNLKTARALERTIPPTILAPADEVIE